MRGTPPPKGELVVEPVGAGYEVQEVAIEGSGWVEVVVTDESSAVEGVEWVVS